MDDNRFSEEGLQSESSAIGIKRVLVRQLKKEMKQQNLSETEMAQEMKMSVAELEILLDPKKTEVSIEIMNRAASVVGRQLRIELL